MDWLDLGEAGCVAGAGVALGEEPYIDDDDGDGATFRIGATLVVWAACEFPLGGRRIAGQAASYL